MMTPTTRSTAWMTGIDHPVIAVKDMNAARAAYERLGFTIPPRGSHVQWGTGNWCIMFPQDYLELRGIIKEGHTHNLAEFLETRGEGLMGLALGTHDAHASYEALAKRGFHPHPIQDLTRNFELPDRWLQPRFSLCFLEERESAGLMSVVFCQHLTPELIRRPQWLEHANGACGVLSLTGAVSDVPAAARTHARLFGKEALRQVDQWLEINTGKGRIVLGTPAEITRRYPEAAALLSVAPRLVAVTLQSRDLRQTARALSSGGVSFRHTASRSIVVAPAESCGVVLEFLEM
jgi:catechol 2,3-dioxygenase-like lactoylglutathione lyase family enzyme